MGLFLSLATAAIADAAGYAKILPILSNKFATIIIRSNLSIRMYIYYKDISTSIS